MTKYYVQAYIRKLPGQCIFKHILRSRAKVCIQNFSLEEAYLATLTYGYAFFNLPIHNTNSDAHLR